MTYKGFLKSMLEIYENVIREELCISRQFFMPMAAKKQFRMKYFLGEGVVVQSPRYGFGFESNV